MRLIAEHILKDVAGQTYVQGELISKPLTPLPRPTSDHTHHLYCSQHNPAAANELLVEVATELDMTLLMDSRLMRTGGKGAPRLLVTSASEDLAKCDHILLYLTGQTWTRGQAATMALEAELLEAMELDVHVLLVRADRSNPPPRLPRRGSAAAERPSTAICRCTRCQAWVDRRRAIR